MLYNLEQPHSQQGWLSLGIVPVYLLFDSAFQYSICSAFLLARELSQQPLSFVI
jgi:hypothetical protein